MIAYQEAPRRFVLERFHDETGISGTGIVAMGTQFNCGKVTTCWCSEQSDIHQIAVWDSIEQVERIHCHGGNSRIRWIDQARKLVKPEEA